MINIKGKDIISTQELSLPEIEAILKLAKKMKANRFSEKYSNLLKNKTFLMFFYNPSLRTRCSFECAATELGGHAQFLEPKSMRLRKTKNGVEIQAGEIIKDAAEVLDRYAEGMGIRILESSVENYGEGNALIREYAKYMKQPVINMADDKYHPCQGLSDIMAMKEHKGNMKGKTILLTWAHGALARSYCSIHANLLITSRMGMNIRIAYPNGYELPPGEIEKVKSNCRINNSKFEVCHDPDEGYTKDVDFVYSRNWFSPDYYQIGKKAEIERASKKTNWICTEKRMKRTSDALFIHPMPIDRGKEVSNKVANGPNSIIIDIAENRLHVQKAIMAMIMGGFEI